MRLAVAICARTDTGGTREERLAAVQLGIEASENSIHRAFPDVTSPSSVMRWLSSSEEIALLAWSNESADHLSGSAPTSEPVLADNGLITLGYFTQPRVRQRMPTTRNLHRLLRGTGGCFTTFRGGSDHVDVVSSIVPGTPIFYGETKLLRVVATRASFVHVICRADSQHIIPENLFGLVSAGFALGDRRPQAGVRDMSTRPSLRIDGKRLEVLSSVPESTPSRPLTDRGLVRATEALSRALIDAVKPLSLLETTPTLALSGGRDSRLLAAVLKAADIEFGAVTSGLPDHPDVVIAAQVADRLDVPHTINLPAQRGGESSLRVEAPMDRATRVADVFEGGVSAWDDAGDPRPWSGQTVMSGLGGEIMRGGYSYGLSDVTKEKAVSKVERLFMAPGLFRQPTLSVAREHAEPWSRTMLDDPFRGLDLLYLTERVGRWGVMRKSNTIQNLFFGPLIDHRVIQAALAVPANWRWSERVMARLIEHLAPELDGIPLEGRPWRYQTTDSRGAASARPRRTFDWRRLQDGKVRRSAVDALLNDDERSDVLFQAVDRAKLEARIEDHSITPAKIWNLLTARALLNLDETPSRGNRRPSFIVEVGETGLPAS